MISWKDVHVQDEIRKDHIAKAEKARMINAIRAEDEINTKNEPNLLLLSAATYLVKLADALRARRTDLSLANEG